MAEMIHSISVLLHKIATNPSTDNHRETLYGESKPCAASAFLLVSKTARSCQAPPVRARHFILGPSVPPGIDRPASFNSFTPTALSPAPNTKSPFHSSSSLFLWPFRKGWSTRPTNRSKLVSWIVDWTCWSSRSYLLGWNGSGLTAFNLEYETADMRDAGREIFAPGVGDEARKEEGGARDKL